MRLNQETFNLINNEFERAYAKHNGYTPASHDMTDRDRLVILVEEVGEIARAMTYDNGDEIELMKELVQVATMACAWLESRYGNN